MGKCLEWFGPEGCRALAESILVGVRPHRHLLDAHCPFHVESTPGGAFFYDPAKDIGKCYSCGEFGDLIAVWCALNGFEQDSAEGFREFRERYAPETDGKPAVRPRIPQEAHSGWKAEAPDAPASSWQERAGQWVEKCAERLQQEAWLLKLLTEWGITSATAKACRLGYNDRDKYPPRRGWGLPVEKDPRSGKVREKFWLPGPSLLLPAYRGGKLIKIKARRFAPEDGPQWAASRKYWEIAGSSRNAFHIYGSPKARAVVLVETERDAALLWQEGRPWNVTAMGTGGTAKTPDRYAEEILRQADVVLVAYDSDAAGAKAWFGFWRKEFPNAIRVLTPSRCGKDIGDSVLPAGLGEASGEWELDRFCDRAFAAFFVPVAEWLAACIPVHVMRAIERDQRRARIQREEEQQEGVRRQEFEALPPSVHRMLRLLRSCSRVGLVCTDDRQGLLGCEDCLQSGSCETFRELSTLFWNDGDVWNYVDERGRVCG